MNITDIRIRKLYHDAMIKALVSITIDEDFAVHDIKVLKGGTGRLFVAMPSRKDDTGIYRDIAHPIDSESRQDLEAKILSVYYEHLENENLSGTAVMDI
ncbi:MAG: septation regulator SpoVG [Oscillospiraceae bacterium]|nr:septation regulator SpoVG [Oscillospiraceae bacterium]